MSIISVEKGYRITDLSIDSGYDFNRIKNKQRLNNEEEDLCGTIESKLMTMYENAGRKSSCRIQFDVSISDIPNGIFKLM